MTDFQRHAAALVKRGYRIIPIPHGQKRPAFSGWQTLVATPEMVRQWGANGYADGNIGVLTQHTPAVDLDILDVTFAREMELFVTDLLGGGLVRVGRAPKRLILFRTDAPFTKRSSPFFIDSAGQKHRVEILATGQQFVAYGIHPDTRKPYEWISFEGEPVDLDPAALPALTATQADQIVAEFSRRAQARGWVQQGHGSVGQVHEVDDNPFFHQRPVVDLTIEQIEEHLADMPDAEVYDTWVRVGAALHHQFGGSDEGKELWDTWSSTAANYDADAIDEKWASFGHYHGTPITFAYVLKFAKEAREKRETDARRQTYAELTAAVTAADSLDVLLDEVAKRIADADLDPARREALVSHVQVRAKKLGGDIGKKQARALIAPSAAIARSIELEISLAQRVLDHHYAQGRHLRGHSDAWWLFAHGTWQRRHEGAVAKRAMETLVTLSKEQEPHMQQLSAQMDNSRGDRLDQLTKTIMSVLARMVSVDDEDDPFNLKGFRAQKVMNNKSGELWIEEDASLRQIPHDPAHKLIWQLNCNYDPKATCPTWDAAIRRVFKNSPNPEAIIRHFYEVFGYLLQPSRDIALWVLFKGPGGNGKSFLLRVISELMGRTVMGMSISEIAKSTNPHFTDSLCGKLMLLDDDLATGTLLPDSWLKKLSEAKLLTANPKYGSTFEFMARAVPVILTNTWPSTVDLSEGLRRRVQVFEANYILVDEEKSPQHLRTILDHELSGVLNHLVAGYQRVLRRGSRFDPPAECLASKETWLAASNPTILFTKERIERTGQSTDAVRANEIYDAYRGWITYQEHNVRALGRNKFYLALEGLGFKLAVRDGYLIVAGIRLRPAEDSGFAEVVDDGLSQGA